MLHQPNAEVTPAGRPRSWKLITLSKTIMPWVSGQCRIELRSARGITCTRSFRIEPVLNVTAVTLKIIRGFHGFHFSPAGWNPTSRVASSIGQRRKQYKQEKGDREGPNVG